MRLERPVLPRILVVANLYPSPEQPAFGTFVGGRVSALRRAGCRVDAVAITDARVHRVVARKYAALALRAVAAALRGRLAGRPYDVVEAHIAFPTGLLAWPAARLSGGRLVLFCHGSDVTRLPWLSPRRTLLARWLFSRADLVIANSSYLAAVAEQRLGPLRRPAIVISPGVEPEPEGLPLPGEREAGRVLFVGRLVPDKGCDVLLAAVEKLAEQGIPVQLTIVGDGPERERLEAAARASGAAVRFTGALPPVSVRRLMAVAAVVAVPSVAPEGLGLVAIEAMASGALVVATDQGGLAETMRHGENGFVVPAGDVGALCSALRRALDVASRPEGVPIRRAGAATAGAHDRDLGVRDSLAHYANLPA
ncbi:MAG: glycosyltransferase [Chloroflexi bacterium]|nr:glycosyltransferase [Chloroflexota bacterium]